MLAGRAGTRVSKPQVLQEGRAGGQRDWHFS